MPNKKEAKQKPKEIKAKAPKKLVEDNASFLEIFNAVNKDESQKRREKQQTQV
jgi:hypothetical protein